MNAGACCTGLAGGAAAVICWGGAAAVGTPAWSHCQFDLIGGCSRIDLCELVGLLFQLLCQMDHNNSRPVMQI